MENWRRGALKKKNAIGKVRENFGMASSMNTIDGAGVDIGILEESTAHAAVRAVFPHYKSMGILSLSLIISKTF